MKLHSLFNKVFCIAILLYSSPILAQFDSLSINKLTGYFSEEGALLSKDESAGLITTESRVGLVFSLSPWFGGRTDINEVRVGHQKYYNDGNFVAGQFNPLSQTKNLVRVTRAEIENHQQNYNVSGYEAPAGIANWPVKSSTASNGHVAEMAPYIDFDGNQSYSPSKGDYPDIIGDEAIYLIRHHATTGAEIHIIAYAFAGEANEALANTIFLSFRIQNRSNISLNFFLQSIWADFDIGDPFDDHMGIDTTNRIIYAYNADNMDESANGIPGFGENPPSVGIKVVCNDLYRSLIYSQGSIAAQEEPDSETEIYNNMRGLWRDSSPLKYGGKGHFSQVGTGAPNAFFHYDGKPSLGTGWTDIDDGYAPGDRKGMMTVFPIDQQAFYFPGWTHSFTVIVGKSNNPNADHLESLESLTNILNDSEEFLVNNYQRHPVIGSSYNCSNVGVGISEHEKFDFTLFPNPAESALRVESADAFDRIEIYNLQGQSIVTRNFAETTGLDIDISMIETGVYLLKLSNKDGSSNMKKFIKR